MSYKYLKFIVLLKLYICKVNAPTDQEEFLSECANFNLAILESEIKFEAT